MFTPKQQQVLEYTAYGYSLQEIADILNCSRKTVEHHRHRIYRKLNTHDAASTAAWYWQRKLAQEGIRDAT